MEDGSVQAPTPSTNVPPVNNTSQDVPPVKLSSAKLVAFMFILIILLLGTTVFFFYQNSQLKKQVALLPKPSPIALATPDPTADWKTYTNIKYHFSFKYPSKWELNDQSGVASSLTLGLSGTQGYFMTINIVDNDKELSVKDYVDKLVSTQGTPGGLPEFDSRENTTIGGLSAVKLLNVFAFEEGDDKIFVAFENYILNISHPTKQENPNLQDPIANYDIVQKILSTFKFTESSGSASPEQRVCTMEAKLCPDGSSVGRTEPNCEFAPCP